MHSIISVYLRYNDEYSVSSHSITTRCDYGRTIDLRLPEYQSIYGAQKSEIWKRKSPRSLAWEKMHEIRWYGRFLNGICENGEFDERFARNLLESLQNNWNNVAGLCPTSPSSFILYCSRRIETTTTLKIYENIFQKITKCSENSIILTCPWLSSYTGWFPPPPYAAIIDWFARIDNYRTRSVSSASAHSSSAHSASTTCNTYDVYRHDENRNEKWTTKTARY